MTTPEPTFDPAEPPPLTIERLARFTVDLAPPIEVGQTPWGRRRIIGITGGHFEGPRLRGEVLPGGADWQVVHADGSATIDTRYALRTHDGAVISLATSGSRHGPPEVIAALARGEAVDPARYSFRVAIRYETAHPDYAWLNRTVAVAAAVRLADTVIYDAYAVR